MMSNIKLHVLCHRQQWEQEGDYLIFPNFAHAHKNMKSQFKQALGKYGIKEDGDETTIDGVSAKITTEDMWEDWEIAQCELVTGSILDYASILDKLSKHFNENLKQLPNNNTESINATESLLKSLSKFEKTLATLSSKTTCPVENESEE